MLINYENCEDKNKDEGNVLKIGNRTLDYITLKVLRKDSKIISSVY